MVTRAKGHKLWRKVRVAADVVLLLSTRNPERDFKNCKIPMLHRDGDLSYVSGD